MAPPSGPNADDRTILALGLALLVAVPALLVVMDGRAPAGPGAAGVVAVVLVALSTPMLAVVARRDGDPTLLRFLLIALAAKLLGAMARFYLTTAAYGGLADAARYDMAGREWVSNLHAGRPVLVAPSLGNFSPGTKATGTITGVVYSVAGRNLLTGFVVFAWLGFWGLLMVYRAFRVGFPAGDHRRYRLLLFFLPSLVFWPSSIGKDAWMQLTLGAIFLGVAWLTCRQPRWTGLVWLGLGVAGAALVRPHIALAALLPLGVALMVRTRTTATVHRKGAAAAVRLIALGVLAVGALLLLNRLGAVFGDDAAGDGAGGAVTGVLDRASRITATGGSEFQATEVTGIGDLPMATISVLFRPFLWEADSAVRAIAALETALLMVLALASWRRLRTLPGRLRRNRYLVYVTAFAVVSIVGFSRVGNEGILARQRTQFLPAVLVLLSLPPAERRRRGAGAGAAYAVQGATLGTVAVARPDGLGTPGPPVATPRESTR